MTSIFSSFSINLISIFLTNQEIYSPHFVVMKMGGIVFFEKWVVEKEEKVLDLRVIYNFMEDCVVENMREKNKM